MLKSNGIEQDAAQAVMIPLSIGNLNFSQSKQAAMVLRAVNHKLRQQMLNLMAQSGRITVTEIYTKLRLEQSVASQHLAILRAARIVKTERDGKFIYYAVNLARVNDLAIHVEQILK